MCNIRAECFSSVNCKVKMDARNVLYVKIKGVDILTKVMIAAWGEILAHRLGSVSV